MQNPDSQTLPAGWFDLLFMAGILAISLFGVNDPLFVFGVLSALFLMWKWRKKTLPFSWIDKAIISVLLYQILNIFLSIEPVSGFFVTKIFLFSVVFYFLLRTGIYNLQKIEKFLFVCCILIALLCTITFITFLLFRSTCAYVGFTSLYDFRYLYKPLGYLSNVWGTLLIGFTGIVLLALHLDNRKKTHLYFYLFLLPLLLWNIVVSFSRGVYISSAVLLFLYLAFLTFSRINSTQKKGIAIILVLSLFISGFVHRQDVFKTLQFNKTLSQQRSIEGRIESMSYSYALLKASPLTGAGVGVYSQVINEYRNEDDNNSFTNFAPNGYTQLLIEQGVFGFILWGMLFVSAFIIVFRKREESPAAVVTGITLIAVLIREATFPVLLESSGLQLSIFTALAVFQNTLHGKKTHKTSKYTRYFPATILGLVLLTCAYSIYHMINDQNNRKALTAMDEGKLEEAEKYISKTSEQTPYLINRSVIFRELYKKTKDTLYLNNAEACLEKAALKNPHDMMIPYYRASVLQEEGRPETALSILTELAQKFPNKSLYQLSVFDLLYNSREEEKAFPHLLQAVKLSPGLLDNSYIKDILSKDPIANKSLKSRLLHDISLEKSTEDPLLLAKSGKLFLSFGLEKEAKACLEKAVLLLPNLIYPRYYLSKIEMRQHNPTQSMIYLKQFIYLYSGYLSKEGIDKIVYSGEIEKLVTEKEKFIDNSYPAKFQTWYHVSPARIDVSLR